MKEECSRTRWENREEDTGDYRKVRAGQIKQVNRYKCAIRKPVTLFEVYVIYTGKAKTTQYHFSNDNIPQSNMCSNIHQRISELTKRRDFTL